VRLLAVAAVLVLAGCAAQREPRGALDARELDWMRSFVHWQTRFDDRASRVQASIEGGGRPGLGPVAECARSFRASVGAAPTARLRRAERLMLDSCARYARGVRAESRFYAGAFGEGMRAQTQLSKAAEGAILAYDALDGLLWESHRLPRVARPSFRSRVQTRYGAVADALTSRAPDVRCWDDADWKRVLRESAAIEDVASVDVDGFAEFDTRRISLSPDVCDALDDLTYRGDRPTHGDALQRLAYAVLVLAHESEHVAGVDSESLATCNGMQHVAGVARLLGATASYGRRLAATYWRELYRQEPDEYRSPQCRPGGALDLSPGDGVWP
jgi:hypothetical protein